jgi:hypothetical protein
MPKIISSLKDIFHYSIRIMNRIIFALAASAGIAVEGITAIVGMILGILLAIGSILVSVVAVIPYILLAKNTKEYAQQVEA